MTSDAVYLPDTLTCQGICHHLLWQWH